MEEFMIIEPIWSWFPKYKHPPRTKGVHLSDILDFIEIMAFGKQKYVETEANAYYAELGFIWEEWVKREHLHAHVDDCYYSGEVEQDGIIGSPDGVSLDKGLIHEMKLTWRSAAKSHPKDRQRWMWQVKGYCKMTGLNKVMFYVMYVNGAYKPMMPRPDCYLFVFSDEEIEENWAMIMTNARHQFMVDLTRQLKDKLLHYGISITELSDHLSLLPAGAELLWEREVWTLGTCVLLCSKLQIPIMFGGECLTKEYKC
jgi:hypothetical protein